MVAEGTASQVPKAAFIALWNWSAVTPGTLALELNQRTGDWFHLMVVTCPRSVTLNCRYADAGVAPATTTAIARPQATRCPFMDVPRHGHALPARTRRARAAAVPGRPAPRARRRSMAPSAVRAQPRGGRPRCA